MDPSRRHVNLALVLLLNSKRSCNIRPGRWQLKFLRYTFLTILPLVVFQSHVTKNPETKISVNEQEKSLNKLITYPVPKKKQRQQQKNNFHVVLSIFSNETLWIVGNSHEFSQKKPWELLVCRRLQSSSIEAMRQKIGRKKG